MKHVNTCLPQHFPLTSQQVLLHYPSLYRNPFHIQPLSLIGRRGIWRPGECQITTSFPQCRVAESCRRSPWVVLEMNGVLFLFPCNPHFLFSFLFNCFLSSHSVSVPLTPSPNRFFFLSGQLELIFPSSPRGHEQLDQSSCLMLCFDSSALLSDI